MWLGAGSSTGGIGPGLPPGGLGKLSIASAASEDGADEFGLAGLVTRCG